MRRRTGAYAVVGVIVAVAMTFVLSDNQRGGHVSFDGDIRIGGTIERLTLPRLDGGGTISYSDDETRPLVLNFFASWCPTCIAEMPAFERIHRASDDEVTFLGISQSDHRDASLSLVAETGVTYDTGFDPEGTLFGAFGSAGMPTTVFIRPGGEIVDVWVGPLDDEGLSDLIDEHFGVAV